MTDAGRLGLQYDDMRCEIRATDRAALVWLAEFLTPSFTSCDPGKVDYRVALEVDQQSYARLFEQLASAAVGERDCFSNDGHFSRYPACVDSDGTTWLHAASDQAFVGIPVTGSTVRVVARGGNTRFRHCLMRVVRELATIEQLRRGRLLLHGSVLTNGGEAVAVCGPKRSGKTTLLMQSLVRGSAFVTNDRMVVRTGSCSATVCGMPTIIRLRIESFDYLPGLAKRCRLSGFRRDLTIAECRAALRGELAVELDDRWPSFSGAQLARLLQAPMATAARLVKIVFPNIQPQARGIELVPLSPAEAGRRLAEALLAPCRPWRYATAFARFSGEAPPLDAIEQQCRKLAQETPAYLCVLGRDAYRGELPWTAWRRRAA